MTRSFVFSSESVTEGHPDKVADNVSDAVLDALLAKDPASRVACETFVATELAVVAGEITSTGFDEIDLEKIVRDTIVDIGYDAPERGMDGAGCELKLRLVEQSPDIAMGTAARADAKIGAGDQGMMFGYAEQGREETDYMPVPISLAHGLTHRLTEVRRSGQLGYLRPDGKSQVSVRYEDGEPVGVDAIVLAAQHDPDVDQESLRADLIEHVVRPVIPDDWLTADTEYFVNHTGKFVKGGPAADTGLTGRKIIVDTYGGWIPHGGGAFSGKDPTKVDRSAAYYARYAAKNLVAAGAAERLQIQVAYAIGSLEPVSINVDTFGTAKMPEQDIEALLRSEFSFAPGNIIEQLDLRSPVFKQTAAYGHFGRSDLDLAWERLDRVEAVQNVAPLA
ncbi:MAG: methionine adenosyltransferase [Thermoplasmatota archaeon]